MGSKGQLPLDFFESVGICDNAPSNVFLIMFSSMKNILIHVYAKRVLAIRRIFSLVDMITKPKFSNCPNIFKIGVFR